MTKQFRGQLYSNRRPRPGKPDPHMLGYAGLGRDRVSLAAWIESDDASKLGTIRMTIRPWGRGTRALSHGELRRNDDRRQPSAPEMIGTAKWKGRSFSVAAWVNKSPTAGLFMKLTFRPLPSREQGSIRAEGSG